MKRRWRAGGRKRWRLNLCRHVTQLHNTVVLQAMSTVSERSHHLQTDISWPFADNLHPLPRRDLPHREHYRRPVLFIIRPVDHLAAQIVPALWIYSRFPNKVKKTWTWEGLYIAIMLQANCLGATSCRWMWTAWIQWLKSLFNPVYLCLYALRNYWCHSQDPAFKGR